MEGRRESSSILGSKTNTKGWNCGIHRKKDHFRLGVLQSVTTVPSTSGTTSALPFLHAISTSYFYGSLEMVIFFILSYTKRRT
mmetsp:Transcript_10708/g.15124  ORF Transcript_10708/g.15124 Transcript_10708/m.15124 type:complete len:83 (+) Transcript_10708:452-700(+)